MLVSFVISYLIQDGDTDEINPASDQSLKETMKNLINQLEVFVQDPTNGLPEDIFLLISRLTPLVNVDLLIRNDQGQTLLTWRDDGHYPPSWHIPGGIIRFKETFAQRIHAVAALELGARVTFAELPLVVNQLIDPREKIRGHFVSFLYQCSLVTPPDPGMEFRHETPKAGEWAWHSRCPENLLAVHKIYRSFF